MADRAPRLSDEEFDEAVARLQEGVVPFASTDMLKRFAETIISKLWERYEQPTESG
jgi:hypothetical protein